MDLLHFLLDQNNIFIAAVAVVAGVMLCLPGLRKGRGANAVDINAATQLVNKSQAVWVDVRPAEQFQAGHIAQARSLPAQDLEAKAGNLPKNKPLILVCEQGRSAPRIAARLRSQGFADVYTLEGGMRAWYAANLPVTQKG
ncbi:rhodanese-like domain-containing protein [Bordetella genomosp. 1]|uniref:Rhodanese n=2 Tax=Bordetella genomosp. 1 TaxID=1395607 RepID=A0ABX4F5L3_9BORD|nr:rhodanese-like domain-containing protein [Bordetella genomosp. 1]MDQ8034012.1 rhodanese-like domain-containing protein [Bordetella sp.]OZI68121.1 rhodanese [Bordetella genomosp. 1]